MIDLIARIQSFKAEQSLLMSYCAGLPFFEQDVLPLLQTVGEGRVTVLLSESEYEASFADLVKGAGIRYRFHPLRLPIPNRKFHPKLYLLLKPGAALLFVASANLTPSGFRGNLEIVDELSIPDNGFGDLQAFSQFAQLLRSLTKLDRRLPNTILRELDEIGTTLDRWVGPSVPSNVGPRLLHSIEQPLLPQLLEVIPSASVSEIVAVSPFFDSQSKAILELAATYPKAKIRLIKTKEIGSLEGSYLSKLKGRIVVEEFIAADDHDRRLHAKVLVFSNSQREWVVSGSANLTRTGLLLSAKNGGNVEAVVVRGYTGSSASDGLLNDIQTQRVDPQKLSWLPKPVDEKVPAGKPTIIDAQLTRGQITILIETKLIPGDQRFRVVVECAGQTTGFALCGVPRPDGSILLQVPAKQGYVQTDDPIAVTVQNEGESGTAMMARSWVTVPFALAFSAAQRGVHSSTRQICHRVFVDDDAASVVADAIGRFLGELAQLTEQPDIAVRREHGADHGEEPDRSISAGDFLISEQGLGNLRETTARTAQAISGLAGLLQKLLIVADTDDETMPPDVTTNDEEVEDVEGQQEDAIKEPPKRDLIKVEDQLNELTEAFRITVHEALNQKISASAVPFVLNLPDAVISFMLLHARIRQRLELEADPQLSYAFREILQDALSVDGVLVGTSFGWLVRANASDESRVALQELLTDGVRVSQLLSFVAAGLAMAGPNSAEVAHAVLGGMHFIIGEAPGKHIDEETQSQLRQIASASGGQIKVEGMEEILRSYSPRQLTTLLLAQRWGVRSGKSCCHAVERDSILSCGTLHMSYPANTSLRLKQAIVDVDCPFCHHVIMPVKKDPMVNSIMKWFDTVLANTQ